MVVVVAVSAERRLVQRRCICRRIAIIVPHQTRIPRFSSPAAFLDTTCATIIFNLCSTVLIRLVVTA